MATAGSGMGASAVAAVDGTLAAADCNSLASSFTPAMNPLPWQSAIAANNTCCGWIATDINGNNRQRIYCANNFIYGLDLFGVGLSGSLTPSLGQIPNLVYLDLGANKLTGAIPDVFGSLQNLTFLSLANNSFSGPLPASLGQLTALNTSLFLYKNKFSGPFPDITRLTKLTKLDVSENSFTGPIDFLGSLVSLQSIDIWGNNFSGAIPATIGTLVGLQTFNGYTNKLSGAIPDSIAQLTQLQYLYLYNNSLTGAIPSTIGQLTNLLKLSLGTNLLSGAVPKTLGSLPSLTELFLNNNTLTGAIPPELGNLGKLTLLELNDNSLTGPIPSTFGNLVSMEQCFLFDNQLSGDLPDSLGQLAKKRLNRLEISNNKFNGTIPLSFFDIASFGFDHQSLTCTGNPKCPPPPTNTTVVPDTNNTASTGMPTGALIGIGVAAAVIVIAIILLAVLYLTRSKKSQPADEKLTGFGVVTRDEVTGEVRPVVPQTAIYPLSQQTLVQLSNQQQQYQHQQFQQQPQQFTLGQPQGQPYISPSPSALSQYSSTSSTAPIYPPGGQVSFAPIMPAAPAGANTNNPNGSLTRVPPPRFASRIGSPANVHVQPQRSSKTYVNVRSWAALDVVAWLYEIGYPETIVVLFRERNIDGNTLLNLTVDGMLKTLGIISVETRVGLLESIDKLRAQAGENVPLPPAYN